MQKNKFTTIMGYLLILLLVSYAVSTFSKPAVPEESPYKTTGDLYEASKSGEIQEMVYDPVTNLVTGLAQQEEESPIEFNIYIAGEETFNDLVDEAKKTNKELKWNVQPTSGTTFWGFLSSILPLVIFIGFGYFIIKKMMGKGAGGGLLSVGKAKVRMSSDKDARITFADVAGADEVVEELEEIKEFLANADKFKALGAKIPTGVLLVGPPGTGKTLLAKAVAGEAGVPFFTMAGSDFVEMFVGVGSSRVRDLFEQAKAAAPCIIFIDEIDAVGRKRSGGSASGGNEEREQTLNQLLVEMDGFHGNSDVIIMAATNRPDMLDSALLRPGRFDRQIMVDRPDLHGREAILNLHAKGKPMVEGITMSGLAKNTAGMSGADLANLLNEAALLAARRGASMIEQEDLKESLERVVAGLKRKHRVLGDKERKIVAYHEAGHALVGHLIPEADKIDKVTILPRGRALGYTLSLPEEDTFLESLEDLKADLAMMLGGRAAEEVIFGSITTGAGNDIERASALAERMVTSFGMSSVLGPRSFGKTHDLLGNEIYETQMSQKTAETIDEEIKSLIDEAYNRAKEIIVQYKKRLVYLSTELLERETIEGEMLGYILNGQYKKYRDLLDS